MQQSPEKSFQPVKNGKSTRNRSLTSSATPVQNKFSILLHETEQNQSSYNKNNEGFQTVSKNKGQKVSQMPKVQHQTKGLVNSKPRKATKESKKILVGQVRKRATNDEGSRPFEIQL